MRTNPLKEGTLTENSAGLGTVTPEMVRERAAELAVINGRSAQEVTKSDWEQAKRELTGEPESDPKEAMLESAPESERWDPVPGSSGSKSTVAPGEDEDDEAVDVEEFAAPHVGESPDGRDRGHQHQEITQADPCHRSHAGVELSLIHI